MPAGYRVLPAAGPIAAPGVVYEPGARGTARQVQRLFGTALAQTRRSLGLEDARASALPALRPVRIVVCWTGDCMRRQGVNPDRRGASTRRGLVIGPTASDKPALLNALLVHELTHAHFRQALGSGYWSVPRWFHEGLAVLLSGDGGGSVPVRTALHELRRGRHFTFACIRDPVSFRHGFGAGDHLHYRQAGLFVGHLRAERPTAFPHLIAALLRGERLCPAFARLFNQDLRQVWQRFRTRGAGHRDR